MATSLFNFTVIEGHVVNDPINIAEREVNFSMKQDDITFDITTKGNLADCVLKYLKPGSRVLVSGNLIASPCNHHMINAKEINFLTMK